MLGVNSNFRFWGEDDPHGSGRALTFDVDGNRYIDYRLAFGPIILGMMKLLMQSKRGKDQRWAP
jgi:glutamate-1-semialdehyde aminotransferase